MLKGKSFLAILAALAVMIPAGSSTAWTQTVITPSPQEQYLLQRGLLRQQREQQRKARVQRRLRQQQEQQIKAQEQQRRRQQQEQQRKKARKQQIQKPQPEQQKKAQ